MTEKKHTLTTLWHKIIDETTTKEDIEEEFKELWKKLQDKLIKISVEFSEATGNDVSEFLYGEDDRYDIFIAGKLKGKQSILKEILE